MNTTPLFKVFIMPRKLKTYITVFLAILGLILVAISYGMANDQAVVVQELSNSMLRGPVNVVANIIELFI